MWIILLVQDDYNVRIGKKLRILYTPILCLFWLNLVLIVSFNCFKEKALLLKMQTKEKHWFLKWDLNISTFTCFRQCVASCNRKFAWTCFLERKLNKAVDLGVEIVCFILVLSKLCRMSLKKIISVSLFFGMINMEFRLTLRMLFLAQLFEDVNGWVQYLKKMLW